MMEVAAEDDDVPRQEQADDAPPSIDEQQPEAQPLHAPPAESGRSGAHDAAGMAMGSGRKPPMCMIDDGHVGVASLAALSACHFAALKTQPLPWPPSAPPAPARLSQAAPELPPPSASPLMIA